MEEHEAEQEAEYPRGRGYGHDYMRGGEVFGGYGYSDRHEYVRPRGATGDEPAATGDDEAFPQDERAGGWAIPPEVDGAPATPGTPADAQPDGARALDGTDLGAGAPVPLIDRTLGGATVGGLDRSRSYYVTQAQLQQRLYRTQKEDGPGKT